MGGNKATIDLLKSIQYAEADVVVVEVLSEDTGQQDLVETLAKVNTALEKVEKPKPSMPPPGTFKPSSELQTRLDYYISHEPAHPIRPNESAPISALLSYLFKVLGWRWKMWARSQNIKNTEKAIKRSRQ